MYGTTAFRFHMQADYIGRTMLSKLLHDWRLLDELGFLRAIYLLGSGNKVTHLLIFIYTSILSFINN